MVAVTIITSAATTRPCPSARGSRRWLTTEWSVSARRTRTTSCSSGGNIAMMRRIVLCASGVCSVERSRCPVSAAFMPVSTVSASRISPMRITSGSWRSAARRPLRKLSVSTPISRCVMLLCRSRCRNSIGFSSVTMCLLRDELMWLIIAAIVLDLPEPVTPVTRIIPRSASVTRRITSGIFSFSKVGTSNGMTRITIMKLDR